MTTFVLIHGAYQGGWIWKPVAERLRAAGHVVFAPSLDGCGERASQVRAGISTESHAAEIAGLLFYEDLRDVVLVGTSTGGMVLCRAAEEARERKQRIDQACADAGRDPIPFSAMIPLEGAPGALIERLGGLAEAGVERVMLQHLAHEDLATVELVGREVIPAV